MPKSNIGWLQVEMVLPQCPRDENALGTPVLIWPRKPIGRAVIEVDGFAYYGRRATGRPAMERRRQKHSTR